MGFKEVLLEKVSKSEIDEALKNPNVMIGAEFEFTLPPFFVKYKEESDKFYKLQDMEEEWEKYEAAWDDLGEGDPFPVLPKWASDEGYGPGDEIPPPTELFPELKIDKNNLFLYMIEDFLKPYKIPFDNYTITSRHDYKSSKKWVIKPDGSLGLSGVEIVSPVMPLREFLKVTPKVFEFINNMGDDAEVGEECGFHIGVSLKNVSNLGKSIDITKLSVFMDEGYIYNFFDTREFNTYAKSAHDSINRNLIGRNAPKLAEKLIDKTELITGFPNDHYMAINIEHLNSSNEYIEFRYLGATDYHRKWDRIKAIVGHYIFNLSLACDPTFKKKEYEHKLSRLLNKIQLFTVCVEMTKMIEEDRDNRDAPEFQKKWKSLWDSWKALYLYKEAVDKDIKTQHGRKGFLRLCAMLDIKPADIIWDYSKNRILKK